MNTAKNILDILRDSEMVTKQGDMRVQDAYSLRCSPQIHGASKDAIEKDIKKVKDLIEKAKEYKGKLSEKWENLYEALKVSEDASRILQNLYVYTHMKQHEDTRINENQSIATKTDMLSTELSMATSYIVPELIAIDDAKLKEYLTHDELAFYEKHISEILREKPHTLT
ncbi:aromatic amino acid lyase, partial [Clostridium tertium]